MNLRHTVSSARPRLVGDGVKPASFRIRRTEERLRVHSFDDTTIIPPDALRTGDGHFYTVFTPFKRRWLASFDDDDYGTLPAAPRVQPELVCPPDPVPEQVTGFDLDRGQPDQWPAGEGSALRQLTRFADERIRKYKRDRDYPACDGCRPACLRLRGRTSQPSATARGPQRHRPPDAIRRRSAVERLEGARHRSFQHWSGGARGRRL